MSRASSPSTARRYGTARVCQLWEVPRSTVYERRARASRPVQPAAKRGPKQAWTDAALTERIRAVLTNSPFLGEGYRKAWARLRLSGVRTSKPESTDGLGCAGCRARNGRFGGCGSGWWRWQGATVAVRACGQEETAVGRRSQACWRQAVERSARPSGVRSGAGSLAAGRGRR